MPIVDIEIVLRANEVIRQEIISELADELGDIFHLSPGKTWVKIQPLAADQYAESGGMSGDVYPLFVTVVIYQPDGKRRVAFGGKIVS
jgi:phenylpyruvate tautomerase PptA (4-oxalocrotonate tautomerase family)